MDAAHAAVLLRSGLRVEAGNLQHATAAFGVVVHHEDPLPFPLLVQEGDATEDRAIGNTDAEDAVLFVLFPERRAVGFVLHELLDALDDFGTVGADPVLEQLHGSPKAQDPLRDVNGFHHISPF